MMMLNRQTPFRSILVPISLLSMTLASLLVAILALLIAVMSAIYTRMQAISSDRLAEIEIDRRHRELTPKFRIRAQVIDESAYPGFARLFVMLAGGQLESLDAATITILNTVEIQPWGLPEGVTEPEADQILWSGWEFDTWFYGGREKKASDHRHSIPRRLSRVEGKDWYELLLRRTAPPKWDKRTGAEWRTGYESVPLRLHLKCQVAGFKTWDIFENVTVEPLKQESAAPGAQGNAEERSEGDS